MPGSIIGEFLLRPIFEFIFEVVMYAIGRIIVPIISFGRIKCDRVTADTPRSTLRRQVFHRRGKQIYLTAESTMAAGCLFLLAVGGIGFLIHYLRKQ